jgi:DSF synthase
MNSSIPLPNRAHHHSDEIVECVDGTTSFRISDQFECTYKRTDAALWSRWKPTGIPSFNSALLHDLERASHVIEGHFSGRQQEKPLDYIVLRSAVHGVFNVGGDLGYFQRLIANQDRASLTEYARAAINVVYRNYLSHNLTGVTTISLLEGDALGGGFECALSCDIVIAEKHVKAGFPEVLFNMFPGMGGMSFLARRVNRKVAEDIVRTGRQYTAVELLDLGIIDAVVETGEGAFAVKDLMKKRERQRGAHAAMNRVDRIVRPIVLQELHEVVKLWVDCALGMSPQSLEWMQRLYQRQLAIFGRRIETAPLAPGLSKISAA